MFRDWFNMSEIPHSIDLQNTIKLPWSHSNGLRGQTALISPTADDHSITHYYMGGPILLSKRWAAYFIWSGRDTTKYRPCHVIMLICHPCPREWENIPPTGHIMLPSGCIICPRASNTALKASGPPAVLEALGPIMQPLGSIFSRIPRAGVAYCTIVTGRTDYIEQASWKLFSR